ncbi:pilus assembly protein CpaB [Salirhabdus euzebyi]|uniref:Pilus assembly protein CpaB n=1 Tax=Salirhabdus euzebyi TaxID=394506 RepID=A0A841Q4N8_9BACI|nr:Flp pilus assembly protein CpaB [Salirhabdus euzebyi]MBB6453323.1 pilus assembly protein CpaB [Salirhabdus euzebyi]
MKTKRIWIWSLVFGILATLALYLFINSNYANNQVAPASTEGTETQQGQDEKEQENVVETASTNASGEEEEFKNELLPIEDGKRAMSINIAGDAQGVSGFITPGSYVDVVANMDVPEDAQEGQHASTVVILQNLKVLAIAHAADTAEEMKRYALATLEVSPEEGLALGFATKYDLYLMLRKEGDNELVEDHLHIHEDELHSGVWIK